MTLTFGPPAGGWPSFGSDGKRKKSILVVTTVYLAGPMRGLAGCNFKEFDKFSGKLRDLLGWEVLSPAEHDRETYGDRLDRTIDCSDDEIGEFFDLQEAMAWDLSAIERSDLVVVLPFWKKSRGVESEMAHAELHGKPILLLTDFGLWDPKAEDYVLKWRHG